MSYQAGTDCCRRVRTDVDPLEEFERRPLMGDRDKSKRIYLARSDYRFRPHNHPFRPKSCIADELMLGATKRHHPTPRINSQWAG